MFWCLSICISLFVQTNRASTRVCLFVRQRGLLYCTDLISLHSIFDYLKLMCFWWLFCSAVYMWIHLIHQFCFWNQNELGQEWMKSSDSTWLFIADSHLYVHSFCFSLSGYSAWHFLVSFCSFCQTSECHFLLPQHWIHLIQLSYSLLIVICMFIHFALVCLDIRHDTFLLTSVFLSNFWMQLPLATAPHHVTMHHTSRGGCTSPQTSSTSLNSSNMSFLSSINHFIEFIWIIKSAIAVPRRSHRNVTNMPKQCLRHHPWPPGAVSLARRTNKGEKLP